MNPLLALFAHWLKMEAPKILALTEAELASRVRGALRAHWESAAGHIVRVVNVHDGITLDPAKQVTERDGKVWTHPQAFLRRVAFWQFHEFVGGTASDFIRDLETAGLIADVMPQLTPSTTPEQAYQLVVEYQLAHLPF